MHLSPPRRPRSRRRSRAGRGLALVLAAVLVVPACGSETPQAAAPADLPTLSLDFDGVPQGIGDGDEVPHGGADALSVVLLTRRASADASAAVSVVEGRDGGQALRLPALVPDATVDGPPLQPLGVISVTPLSLASPHPLDPGDRPFTFGAAFRLDERTAGSKVDDGDNLIGRGSFSDPAQYKVQVDAGVPSCRVQGEDGTVLVKADTEVDPERWYTVRCSRADDGLELALTSYEGDEPRTQTWSGAGLTGDLGLLAPAVPLAVGGKLTSVGGLVRSETDQLNGTIDDVLLRIDG